jgi:hypothetical protein
VSCPVCGEPLPEGQLVNCSRRCTVRAAEMRYRGLPIDTPRREVEPGKTNVSTSLTAGLLAWLDAEVARRGSNRSRVLAGLVQRAACGLAVLGAVARRTRSGGLVNRYPPFSRGRYEHALAEIRHIANLRAIAASTKVCACGHAIPSLSRTTCPPCTWSAAAPPASAIPSVDMRRVRALLARPRESLDVVELAQLSQGAAELRARLLRFKAAHRVDVELSPELEAVLADLVGVA